MALPNDWNSGGDAQTPGTRKPGLRVILNGLTGLTDQTTAKALTAAERYDGMLITIPGDGTWRYSETSLLSDDGVLVAEPADGLGAFLRQDTFVDVRLPVTFATLDAAVLWTVPAGYELVVVSTAWEVTADWTGGTASAIGLSSSNAGLSTPGDLLGGAGGDVAATLVASGPKYVGTKGVKVGNPAAVLVGGDTVVFNRVVSAFTAGAGYAHLFVSVAAIPAS